LIYIDSAFIDTYIASESIKTEPKLTEEIKTEKLSLDKVTEYLTASVIGIEKSPEIELPNKEIVKSQYQVASVVFDNQTGFVWNIPPLIKPAKSYEFIISDDSLNLEDLSFKSNKSVQIEFIEKVDSDLFFSFQTNAIGSIEIQLLNKNNVIDSKSIDSLMIAGNNISESDIDYEKIKLLSIMGFLSNTQLDLDSKISLYESIKQITKYLNFKGFETQNPQTDVVFYESEKYDNKLLSQAFSFGLISESDLISLDKNIDMGEFFKRYYKSTDSYVSALPKWPFKSFIRSFGANKLYVQQALIDNLITEEQLSSSYLTTRDLINITYNVIVKK